MADYVELVIKIYKNTYDRITSRFADGDDIVLFENLLKNGTLLPKGHGRLIDADKFISEHFGEVSRLVDDAPTIIEADKTESEETNEQTN